ncbi:MAG: hypothetical protein QG597_2528 [Actinomycetota bacterium]|nr:hypothetical protein [Actinomycetota bacterium]
MAQFDPRTLAPLVSMAATWAVRKALTEGYRKTTGNLPPQRTDLGTPIGTVLLWAGLTALTTALIDVMIQRGAAKYEEHRMLSHQVGPGGQHSAGA